MAQDPRRNKHHFLARHFLQNFAGGDGLVFVHDRKNAWSARQDIPERLAMEKYLYAPETALEPGDDPKDDSVERWLATEIDGPAYEPIAQLATGAALRDLSPASTHAIADFIALLDLRTPAVRDLLMPAFHGAAENEISQTKRTQRELRKRGVYVSRGEVRRVARNKGPEIAGGLAKPGWLNYLMDTRQIARINLKARRWSILIAPASVEFITSDLGIAKSLLGPMEPAPWEPGTLLGRAHWIIPFSPERALAITPQNAPDPATSSLLVARTNGQLIADARRYVYSHKALHPDLFANAGESEGRGGTPYRTV